MAYSPKRRAKVGKTPRATRAAKAAKPKKPAVRSISENEIHLKAWQWVSKTYPELLIFHVANERDAPVQFHVKMKRKGVLAGVADFLAFPSGRKIAIELKDDEGDQNNEQIKFQKRWERTGGVYFLVRTFEDFQNIIAATMFFSQEKP